MKLPGFLLRHKVQVQAYTGTWGDYAPTTVVRCFWKAALTTTAANPGVERVALHTLIAPPDAVLPAGSRVTLPDGQVGYISASVLHSGGGLPTPDHVEAAVNVGSQYGPAFGETVVLLRRTVAGQDRYGSDTWTTTTVPIAGCAVRALTSAETLGDQRNQITDAIEVIFPPGTQVAATDAMVVRGLRYEIDGTPDTQVSPQTGVAAGVRAVGRRVTG